MKKAELINVADKFKQGLKIDNGPNNKRLDKEGLLEKLKNKNPVKNTKSKVLDNVRNSLNKNLADPEKVVAFKESAEWKPRKTSVKDIAQNVLIEAELENRKPNAFRLNIQPMALDMAHAKFSATRGDKNAVVEILFPNTNGKISIKVQLDGAEDKLLEVGLEDDEYINNLGIYIIKLIDESIEESKNSAQGGFNDSTVMSGDGITAPAAGLGRGTHTDFMESDARTISELMPLIEQGDDEDSDEDVDVDEGEDTEELDVGEGGEELGEGGTEPDLDFGEEDFSEGGGGGFGGGGFGGDDLGGFGDEGEADAEGVNAEDSQLGEEEERMKFEEKTDWLNSALDTMLKLTAEKASESMQDGEGVKLTTDEVIHGTSGLQGSTNKEIIDAFLGSVYGEDLKDKSFTEEGLKEIEEKLSLNDGQFAVFMKKNLDRLTGGEEEVGETLGTDELFSPDFEPMGGEKESKGGDQEFDEFLDIADDFATEEEGTSPEQIEAKQDIESDLGGELDEFTGTGKAEPEEKEKKEK